MSIERQDMRLKYTNICIRGAYCAMVTISLLNLPLELPPEAEVRKHGLRTFLDGLPEYLSRCEFEKSLR